MAKDHDTKATVVEVRVAAKLLIDSCEGWRVGCRVGAW